MKKLTILLICIWAMAQSVSCKKTNEKPPLVDTSKNNVVDTLKGGKGGQFSVALFTTFAKKSAKARIYLKYAANKAPADTNMYEEAKNTMTEPGYGNHAHFTALQPGTYYFKAQGLGVKSDTVIVITNTSKETQDAYLDMK
jgi:hypothetical protein